ncbi:hypothetical protein GH714_042250 [Hevea brasiliensis]|uniref:Uncharacterized protein n=1 Tax=Hevea brasiliensis TaxID=3981 RepID=A0A6A6MYJ9_HEVBR|nr:hypothetical protein GH714_042250 [Hevea brasiliensis]
MSSPDDSVLATWSNKSRTNRKNNILKKKGSNQNAEPLDLGFVDGKEPKPAILGPQEAGEANLSQLHKSKRYDPVPVVSTAFSEGKFSLEDYVSNLRAVVGIQALVDAIGIGKGKEDLTSLAMEPARSNPLFTVCPIGKACSSLTSSDIIKLLTGGFRLSKARSNDIFWEAVWPRLLARGWHSEQPNNQSYVGPNHHLVFLIPGVKKFSKRKLVKGNHYFDSVSDVLSKVASEPKLIELDSEEARGSSCNEEDSLEDSTGGLPGATCFGMETSHRQNVKRQTPSLIDLNLPQLSLDCENNEAALMDVESSHKAKADSTLSLSSSDKTDPEALSTSVDASPAVEQPSLNPRRQSRRNRPLTTRALEAFECGFLGVKRQKSLHVPTQEISYSSSSHWVHSKVKVRSSNGNAGSGIVNAKDGDANGAFNKKDFVKKLLTELKKSAD